MRERLKELWQQARVPASSGWNRLEGAARRLGHWLGRTLALAGRALARALVATFSWRGGLLAARWIVVLTVVAGLGYFLGRSRPEILPTMPWERAPAGQVVLTGTATPALSETDLLLGSEAPPVSDGLPTLFPAAGPGESVLELSDPTSASGGPQAQSQPWPAAEERVSAAETVLPPADPFQMAVPVMGSLGQPYAWRRDSTTQAWRLHDGVDLVAAARQPVTAALQGRVAQVLPTSSGGFAVWLEHGGGWMTRYEALSEVFVVEGQPVAQGQAVGRVGRLDDGTNLGVHFAVYRDGQPQDPARFIPTLRP